MLPGSNETITEQKDYDPYDRCGGLVIEEETKTTRTVQMTQITSSPAPASPVVIGRNLKTDKDIIITDTERTSGLHVLGGTGTGKSTLATRISLGDILNGHGLLFIDVEGDSIDDLLPHIPQERMDDVILLDLVELGERGRYIGINPLFGVKTSRDVDRYMQIFKSLWNIGPETPRLENTLRALLLTLAYCKLSISEIPALFRDAAFRGRCVASIPSSLATDWVRWYWQNDFNKLNAHLQTERSDTILNKVLQFLMTEAVSYPISQYTNTVDFRELMEQKKIILLRLSVQELGKDTVRFLGMFLMEALKAALFSRADVDKEERVFFSFIADEWQLYTTPDFEEILTRGRKYGIGAMVLNQTLAQLPRELKAITQQLNMHVTFRVGVDDAETRAPLYARDPQPEVRLENIRIISPTPVDTIIFHRPHVNMRVNTVLKPWRETVQVALGRINEGEIPESSTTTISRRGMTRTYTRPGRSWSNREDVAEAQKWLDKINDFLYQAMLRKNPCQLMPVDLLQWMAEEFEFPFFDLEQYKKWSFDEKRYEPRDYISPLLKNELTFVDTYNHLWMVEDKELSQAFLTYEYLVREDIRNKLMTEFYIALHDLEGQEINNYYLGHDTRDLPSPPPRYLRSNDSLIQIYSALHERGLVFFYSFDQTTLIWEFSRDMSHVFKYRLQAGQEGKFPLNRIEEEIERIILEQKPPFETFVRDYRSVMQALATDPVMDTSGVVEEKPSSQRSFADMEKEKAKELLGLPNGTAYLSIGSRGDRFKPRMETKVLPKTAAGKLAAHREQALRNAYQYTTTIENIEKQVQKRRNRQTVEVRTPVPTAKRRVYVSSSDGVLPALAFEEDYLMLLYHFHYLTLEQVCRLKQKQKPHEKTHEREKINALATEDKGFITKKPVTVATQAGRVPLVYSLSQKGIKHLEAAFGVSPGTRKGTFNEHTLLVNDALIACVLASKLEPCLHLVDLKHERTFEQQKIQLGDTHFLQPDGFLHFQLFPPFGVENESVGLFLEIDREKEGKAVIQDKLQKYITFASEVYKQQFGLDALTGAFCVPGGSIRNLLLWTEQAFQNDQEQAASFIFTDSDPATTNPLEWVTAPLWYQPFDTKPHALIERMLI